MKKLFVLMVAGFMVASAHADLTEWEAAISAKNPLHWYKFDEAAGTNCIDSGSAGLNGVYTGVSLGQAGYFGGGTAARFTRSNGDVVNFTGASDLSGPWTAEYIIKTVKPPAGQEPQALHDSATTSVRLAGWTALGEAGFTLYGVADYRFTPATGLTLNDLIVAQDEWMHLVWRNNGSGTQLFFNGKLVGTNTNSIALGRLRIGSHGAVTNALDGVFDEAVVFARALTDADIIAHARAASLVDESIFKASNPSPADGAEGVTLALLSWTAGASAAFHDVYFGTTPDLGPVNRVTRNPKTVTVYYHGAGLESGTTYYWRIDEVDADGVTIYEGDVWSFTVAPLTAWNPNPPDGVKLVDPDEDLSWNPGATAFTHDIYFGTDETAVADGAGDTFKGNWPDTSYELGTLALETTYYWRVDEVEQGGTKHTGDVWSFKTLPDIPVADADLLAWWKLDRGYGSTVLDWSGHGNDGTLANGPQWVAGYDGGALKFDGTDDYVDLGTPSELYLPENYTYTAWFKVGRDIDGDSGPQYLLCIGSRSDLVFGVEDGVGTNGDLSLHYYDTAPGFHAVSVGQTVWSSDEWHMVAGTKDSATGHKIYLDGELKNSDTNTNNDNYATSRMISIGARAWTGHQFFNGTIDDVRIYSRALTQEEIKQVMRIDPLLAWDPSPVNGSTPDIDGATPLSWSPGEKAAQHDVYFGTDRTAVTDADASDTTGIYRGRQAATSYTPGEALVWGGGPYYWRIDEVNSDATISRGRVWSFTVADYLIVDDFERYDDYCDRIFYAWKDGWGYSADPDCGVIASTGNGTGSTVGNLNFPYAEQTIVHSGTQSMPFEYNNTGTSGKTRYSEASLEFASARDWIRWDVKSLSLWFHGETGNTPETLYVAVEDSAGQVRVATHPDPEALQVAAWQEWNIDLQQFAGVNLASVKKVYLGVGNRVSPQAGGSGKIYIDDIRLYRPRCLPDLKKPAGDLTDDCTVDYADLQILTNNWLISTYEVIPAAPGTTGLAGHWTFDNAADLGADSTGNNNGTIDGDASRSANAQVGSGSLALDGDGDFINVRGGTFFSALDDDGDGFTVAAWVQFAPRGQYSIMRVFSTNMSAGGSGGWGFGIIQPPARVRFTTYGIRDYDTGDLSGYLPSGQWVHVAAVYKSDGDVDFYIDGSWAETLAGNFSMNDTQGFLIGGLAAPTATEWFEGLIDDLHIYDRELSQGEVGWLAGKTTPYNQDLSLLLTPRNPAINGYEDATIDL